MSNINSEKSKTLFKNTFLLTVCSFGSKVLVFFLAPIYTSILSTSDYGMANLVITTANLMFYIGTVNISDAVFRFVLEKNSKKNEILFIGLKITIFGSSIVSVLFLFFRRFIGLYWPIYSYYILVIYLLIIGIQNVFVSFLRSTDRMKEAAISGVISTFFYVFSNILFLVVLKLGVLGYMISLCVGPISAVVYEYKYIQEYTKLNYDKEYIKSKQKEMLRYSTPLIFNSIAWWANSGLDKYFITYFFDEAHNGVYAISQNIPTILETISNTFIQSWNLSSITEFDKNDKDLFFLETYKQYNGILMIACSALIILNIPIASFLYPNDFFVSWKYSSILLFSVIISSQGGFLASIIMALKQNKIISVTMIIGALTNALLNYLLIPRIGIIGAALSTVVSFAIVWLMRMIYVKANMSFKVNVIKELVIYALIVVQLVLEKTNKHGYPGQLVIFIIICFIYKKEIVKVLSIVSSLVINWLKPINSRDNL